MGALMFLARSLVALGSLGSLGVPSEPGWFLMRP